MQDYQDYSMEQLASTIAAHLKAHDIDVVLVGGLAVALYTDNRYLTSDIDMVDVSHQDPAHLQAVMAELGFDKEGRIYTHNSTDIVVEFPAAPLAVGDELISETTTMKGPWGNIPILYAVDVVKDRLAAYIHWQDQQSLVQALCIMLCHGIAPNAIKLFCKNKGMVDQYAQIDSYFKALKKQGIKDMSEIEDYIVSEQIKGL
jgi:hypothetical protein